MAKLANAARVWLYVVLLSLGGVTLAGGGCGKLKRKKSKEGPGGAPAIEFRVWDPFPEHSNFHANKPAHDGPAEVIWLSQDTAGAIYRLQRELSAAGTSYSLYKSTTTGHQLAAQRFAAELLASSQVYRHLIYKIYAEKRCSEA